MGRCPRRKVSRQSTPVTERRADENLRVIPGNGRFPFLTVPCIPARRESTRCTTVESSLCHLRDLGHLHGNIFRLGLALGGLIFAKVSLPLPWLRAQGQGAILGPVMPGPQFRLRAAMIGL